MTKWVKRDKNGLYLGTKMHRPHFGFTLPDFQCVVARFDRDGESDSIFHTHCIFDGQSEVFIKLDDGIGEVIHPDEVQAYFAYTPFIQGAGT